MIDSAALCTCLLVCSVALSGEQCAHRHPTCQWKHDSHKLILTGCGEVWLVICAGWVQENMTLVNLAEGRLPFLLIRALYRQTQCSSICSSLYTCTTLL